MRRRRLRLGLATLLGLAERGIFIPYRYAADLPRPGVRPGYAAIETLFRGCEPAFRDMLRAVDDHADALLAIGSAPPPEPRWTQDWFPRLDAAAAYTMVRRLQPQRIVEIGSGHSTRFVLRALADGGIDAQVVAIDPAPRADLAGLADRLDLRRCTVQAAGTEPFAALAADDLLLIDSSHILMPGTDVDMLVNRILPAMPAGIVVQFHDMFLPDDYPAEWAWRGYNEQLAVAALLTGGGFEPLFASHYAITRMREEVEATVIGRLPLVAGAHESGLWLRKRAAPLARI